MKSPLFFLLPAIWVMFGFFQTETRQVSFTEPFELKKYLRYTPDRDLKLISAHRGGRFIEGFPENALATFEYTYQQNEKVLIECDVAMTADGELILMHDQSLDRTTTGTGMVRGKTWKEIAGLNLIDDFGHVTEYRVPHFEEVLQWAKQKAILTVDVKRGVPFEKVVALIRKHNMENGALIITYNAADVQKVYQLDPGLMISASIRNEEELHRIEQTGVPFENLVAFTGTTLAPASLYEMLHQRGVLCILGTMGNLDQRAEARGLHTYLEYFAAGADMLATDKPLEVQRAIEKGRH